MTISSYDPIAVWHFNSRKSNEYFKYSNVDYGSYPVWIFWNLRKALNILNDSKILQVDKLTFLGVEEVVIDFQGEDKTVDEVVEIIVNAIDTAKASPSIRFTGRTILREDEKEIRFSNIVQIHCSLNLGSITISLFSDCWVPIDRNDKLQVDLAEKCSPVLSDTLYKIKELGFESVYPDSTEEYTDEILPQYGFKVYLYDSAVNEIEYNKLSKENRMIIDKYLWKNRLTTHPA